MTLIDEERVSEDDKVLVVVTNQYMWMQLEWYRSRYPEGIWDALIIPFGGTNDGKDLMRILYDKCIRSNYFANVYIYDKRWDVSTLIEKSILMFGYMLQYITGRREIHDLKLIRCILGDCQYQKIIVHNRFCICATALINVFHDSVIICLEDGFADYIPVARIRNINSFKGLLYYVLGKMNVMSFPVDGYCIGLKYDSRIIKYSSLPDKMQNRNYKQIKQLFEDKISKPIFADEEVKKNFAYDIIVFSSPYNEVDHSEQVYYILHEYLSANYSDKKVLIKPHPRETYRFDWEDPNIEIGYLDMAGEEVLDVFPEADILFAGTSTILIKACRTKRNFKIIVFGCIKSKQFRKHIEQDSQLMELSEDKFIHL